MKARKGRVRIGAGLAAAALFGGAGLVVDHGGDGGNAAQNPLDVVKLMAAARLDAAGQQARAPIFFREFADDDDARDIFRQQLARDHRHGQAALDRLAAGHRHRVVVENLVGDRGFRRHRRADRQQARMLVGAVAEIGEDVLRRW